MNIYHLFWKKLSGLFPWGHTHTEPFHGTIPRQSVFIRAIDCGSSNAEEIEIAALFNPIYDLERFGFHLVETPRQADVLLLTGPFTRSMAAAALAAFKAMPDPHWVITIGDGFSDASLFQGSYAIIPLPAELVAARLVHIPGNPPGPQAILETLTRITFKGV
jgi:Ni,Fe-hydrogenase III small subunit